MKNAKRNNVFLLAIAALLGSLHLQASELPEQNVQSLANPHTELQASLLKAIARESYFHDQLHRPENAMTPTQEHSASKFVTALSNHEAIRKILNRPTITQGDLDELSHTKPLLKQFIDDTTPYTGAQGRQAFRDLLQKTDTSPFEETSNYYQRRSNQEADNYDKQSNELLTQLQSLPENEYRKVVDNTYSKMSLIEQAKQLLTDNVINLFKSNIEKLTIPQDLSIADKNKFITEYLQKNIAIVLKLAPSSTRLPIVQDLIMETLKPLIAKKAKAKASNVQALDAIKLSPEQQNDFETIRSLTQKLQNRTSSPEEFNQLNALKLKYNFQKTPGIHADYLSPQEQLRYGQRLIQLSTDNRTLSPAEFNERTAIKVANNLTS